MTRRLGPVGSWLLTPRILASPHGLHPFPDGAQLGFQAVGTALQVVQLILHRPWRSSRRSPPPPAPAGGSRGTAHAPASSASQSIASAPPGASRSKVSGGAGNGTESHSPARHGAQAARSASISSWHDPSPFLSREGAVPAPSVSGSRLPVLSGSSAPARVRRRVPIQAACPGEPPHGFGAKAMPPEGRLHPSAALDGMLLAPGVSRGEDASTWSLRLRPVP